jgi:hypothetical protein
MIRHPWTPPEMTFEAQERDETKMHVSSIESKGNNGNNHHLLLENRNRNG